MKKLVHTRDISMRTADLGNHYVLVEGSLIDQQYQSGHAKTSERSELVHHMVIRLKIKGPGMQIEQAEATMPHHPRKECPEVLPWIRNLEGLEIAPGYRLEGKEGHWRYQGMRTPDESRHRHGRVRSPGILGCL